MFNNDKMFNFGELDGINYYWYNLYHERNVLICRGYRSYVIYKSLINFFIKHNIYRITNATMYPNTPYIPLIPFYNHVMKKF